MPGCKTSFKITFSTYNGILQDKDFLSIKEKILSISNNNFDTITLSQEWSDYHFSKKISFILEPIPFFQLEGIVFRIEISTSNEDKTECKTYEKEYTEELFYSERNKIIDYYRDLFFGKEDFDFDDFVLKNE